MDNQPIRISPGTILGKSYLSTGVAHVQLPAPSLPLLGQSSVRNEAKVGDMRPGRMDGEQDF